MQCPLIHPDFTDLRALARQCRAAKCDYIESVWDTDYLPDNCVLLVAAMLEVDADDEGLTGEKMEVV